MADAPIEFLKARSVSDVINATFSFIRQNARPLGKSLLYIVGPAVAVTAVFTAMFQARFFGLGMLTETDEEAMLDALGSISGLLGGTLLFSILTTTLTLVVVLGYVHLYRQRGPANITVDDVWAVTRQQFWRMLGLGVVVALVVMLPVVIVIIPCLGALAYLAWAVWAGFTFALAFPVRMEEQSGVIEALARSRALVKGFFWPTAGALFLAYLIYSVLSNAFAMPAVIVSFLYGMHSLDGGGGGVLYQFIILASTVLQTVASTALYCVPILTIAFQYFNLVEQQEHVGLRARIEQVHPGDGDGMESGSQPGEALS
ncbi:MAG: hypothetical protein GVY18_04875 [Bacteroidetes bacterium]|jgi:hypothetical protein|nr:hypothetical protein [Bacteroidota bacterium]